MKHRYFLFPGLITKKTKYIFCILWILLHQNRILTATTNVHQVISSQSVNIYHNSMKLQKDQSGKANTSDGMEVNTQILITRKVHDNIHNLISSSNSYRYLNPTPSIALQFNRREFQAKKGTQRFLLYSDRKTNDLIKSKNYGVNQNPAY